MLTNKNILILAPHTDDGELGCGATIAKALTVGAKVSYIAFSTAEESVPDGFPKNQLESELKDATHILGIDPEDVYVYKYEVRKLNYVRQEILESLIEIRNHLQPDIVFMPSLKDIHQDHTTIANEGLRAFKNSTILGYELMWNNLSFETDCFIHVSEEDIQKKIDALHAYKTQAGKTYMSQDFIKSLATVRGVQVNTKYAEAFEVLRLIID